jgi:hypothetical protein
LADIGGCTIERMANPSFTNAQPRWLWLVSGAAGLGLVVGLTVANYNFARQSPGGYDFLIQWVGTRALLFEGQTPYSDSVADRIQQLTYGRPVRPGEPETRSPYPLYAALLFAPFALPAEYALARALWMTFLEVGLLGLVFISLHLTHWRPSPKLLPGLFLFSLIWYHGVRPVINGNAVVWVAICLALSLVALRAQRDALAGVGLALTTIKPNLALLPLLLILLWASAQRRWVVGRWFIGTTLVLSLLAMLWVPDWPLQNFAEIVRYSGFSTPTTPGTAFAQWWPGIGRWLGWALSAVVTVTLLWAWRHVWHNPGWDMLLWTMCLTLALGQWSGITTDPGNYILLLLPLMLIFAQAQAKWGAPATWGIGLTLIVLLIGLWAIFILTLEQGDQPGQSPIMFFPLPAMVLVGLWLTRNR